MKVIIMGLGLYEKGSGISAAKFFIEKGDEVLITDLKERKELLRQIKELEKFCKNHNKKMPILHLGGHKEDDFKSVDIVMRNPGVPKDSLFLKIARKAGAQIETDVTIFMKNCHAMVIGVTGTRGKSTTASLIYEILKKSPLTPLCKRGEKGGIWLGGNIKISPLSFIEKVKPSDIVVLEFSSWMLENFSEYKIAPHIAVITNIYPDHLNTYKNMAEYISAKKNIFQYQKAGDYLVLNGENRETKKWKGYGKTIYFYKENIKKFYKLPIKLQGEHNLENISAAYAVVKIMKVPVAKIEKVLKKFNGLSDRQEIIAQNKGITFVNDTTATTPDGTIAALRRFGANQEIKKTRKQKNKKTRKQESKKIILICGGSDKGLDYKQFAKEAKKYCKAVIFFPGTATEKINYKLSIINYQLIIMAKDMNSAVKKARQQAIRGDIILLSPAAASFGLFKNEFDRGEEFKKVVTQVTQKEQHR
ncbi:UDP-N-acetylmuramoyl-L-alanine--D-glutamate ligase [Candidatus Parcubacteria bacterium]|nr:UDP-N-acetylmuramoyl-L-alanine--D-glutamate ligase [Patescibacteria group bacterium]MCG2694275.1 UDP-N-acetylmuramoyl-L-alanine--D-glutamate ligase [Candidatus Parcubacteria bacterium]